MTAANDYAAMVDAVNAQRVLIRNRQQPDDPWSGQAQRFRFDPHRNLNANLEIIASHVHLEDVLLDVGGGAGRFGLPLALRCRELINVDPSAAMREEFEACAAEASITNARFVQTNWLEAEGICGDLALTANVTYFVRDIVPFIQKLHAASRRRVMIIVLSIPYPNRNAELFRLVYGKEQKFVPGHQELLSVLWEMGFLPDVQVLPGRSWDEQLPQSREEAIGQALEGRWIFPEDRERARNLIESRFDELFAPEEAGFQQLWHAPVRELLITWETG